MFTIEELIAYLQNQTHPNLALPFIKYFAENYHEHLYNPEQGRCHKKRQRDQVYITYFKGSEDNPNRIPRNTAFAEIWVINEGIELKLYIERSEIIRLQQETNIIFDQRNQKHNDRGRIRICGPDVKKPDINEVIQWINQAIEYQRG